MAVNVTKDYLIANGVDPALLDRLLADPTGAAAGPSAGPSAGRPGGGRRGAVLVVPGEPTLVGVESGAGWWQVTIADWRPVSDNLRAKGVWAWHRGKARDREVIRRLIVEEAGVPLAFGRRRVSLVVEKRNRRGIFDTPNVLKSFHDSLKTCGLLVDDSDEWLDWEKPRIVVNRELKYDVISCICLRELVS